MKVLDRPGEGEEVSDDFLDELIKERTKENPNFSRLIDDAAKKRDEKRRKAILDTVVGDLGTAFVYYDRKEDEDDPFEHCTLLELGHCPACVGRAAKAETERDALAAENARLRAELADLPRLRELDDSIVGLEEALDELEAIAVEHNDPHGFTAEWKAQQVVCQEAKRRRAAAITVARDARAKAAPACPHGYAAGLRCPWLCKAKAAPEGGGA